MAKKNTQEGSNPIEDMKSYQQAVVAVGLLQTEEGATYVPGASINLGKDLGLSGPATVYEEAVRASPEATQNLLKIASRRYIDSKRKSGIGELFDLYAEGGGINDYASEEDVNRIKGLFGNYLEKTVGDVEKEIGDAEYVLNPRTNSSDEQKATARETVKERKELLGRLQIFENYYLEDGRQRAVKATIKPTLEAILSEAS